jgi:hypothetical protein
MNPTPTQSGLDDMRNYAESLLMEKFADEPVDADIRDTLIDDVMMRLNERIMTMIALQLSEEQLEQLNTLIDTTADESAVRVFIAESVADLPTVISGAMVDFRAAYLGLEV